MRFYQLIWILKKIWIPETLITLLLLDPILGLNSSFQ